MRVPVTREAVCSLSTCRDTHAVSYNAVNSHPSVYKMNISCFKLSLKLPGMVPCSDMEGLSISLLILMFFLSPSHPLHLFLPLQAKAAQASHPT